MTGFRVADLIIGEVLESCQEHIWMQQVLAKMPSHAVRRTLADHLVIQRINERLPDMKLDDKYLDSAEEPVSHLTSSYRYLDSNPSR